MLSDIEYFNILEQINLSYFVREIKANDDLLEWINNKSDPKIDNLPYSFAIRLHTKCYLILHPEESIYCECGKPRKYEGKFNRLTCDVHCPIKAKIARNTCLRKYNVSSPMLLQEVKDKQKASIKNHYGVEYPMQCKELRDKAAKTNLTKYGTKFATQSEQVKEKTIKTNMERYHVKSTAQVPEFREAQKKTLWEHYHVESPLQSKELMEKFKNTNIERYNTPWAITSKEVQDKSNKTKMDRYHTTSMSSVPEICAKQVATRKETMLKKCGKEHESQVHISDESYEVLNDPIKFSEMLIKYGKPIMAQLLGVE
jgi:hypothetical protein